MGRARSILATVLFAWELGGGLGHITQLAPLANALARRRHLVYAALRELKSAACRFDPGVRLLAAPHLARSLGPPTPTRSFVDILSDLTVGDERVSAAHANAWRNLLELTGPDVAVFDHSPTALLASRGISLRRVLIGNGFIVPPGASPFPPLRPSSREVLAALVSSEHRTVERANRVLARARRPALDSLGELYSDVDATLLTTFPELDPYLSFRPAGTEYLGPVNATGGGLPEWPDVAGKKLYAYLSPFAGLNSVLDQLMARPAPTVAFVPGIDPGLRWRFSSPTLRVSEHPLDLAPVAAECDGALLNGNLGTTAALLLASRPTLHLPLFFEHVLNARSVERIGAGLVADARRPEVAADHLAALFGSDAYAFGARAFAAARAPFDPARQFKRMLDCLLGLLGSD
jgi:UDP:flavonoid glycosyltransferase YjiC (YdhE family)